MVAENETTSPSPNTRPLDTPPPPPYPNPALAQNKSEVVKEKNGTTSPSYKTRPSFIPPPPPYPNPALAKTEAPVEILKENNQKQQSSITNTPEEKQKNIHPNWWDTFSDLVSNILSALGNRHEIDINNSEAENDDDETDFDDPDYDPDFENSDIRKQILASQEKKDQLLGLKEHLVSQIRNELLPKYFASSNTFLGFKTRAYYKKTYLSIFALELEKADPLSLDTCISNCEKTYPQIYKNAMKGKKVAALINNAKAEIQRIKDSASITITPSKNIILAGLTATPPLNQNSSSVIKNEGPHQTSEQANSNNLPNFQIREKACFYKTSGGNEVNALKIHKGSAVSIDNPILLPRKRS